MMRAVSRLFPGFAAGSLVSNVLDAARAQKKQPCSLAVPLLDVVLHCIATCTAWCRHIPMSIV